MYPCLRVPGIKRKIYITSVCLYTYGFCVEVVRCRLGEAACDLILKRKRNKLICYVMSM